jgi:hypothetical protein
MPLEPPVIRAVLPRRSIFIAYPLCLLPDESMQKAAFWPLDFSFKKMTCKDNYFLLIMSLH